ncbi:MAG: hypothetical protein KJ606_10110 [Chloroflexi bacterium]|nr:hypothetical protein [Chloroflexota bacterium]
MKFNTRIGFVLLFGALALAACNLPASGLGPTAWLDRPLDGEAVPLAPLIIQAHASDADGVAIFEFFVFDGLLASVPASGGWLGEASIERTFESASRQAARSGPLS